MDPLSAALSLFPSLEHVEATAGPYGHVVEARPVSLDALNPELLSGVQAEFRSVAWIEELEDAVFNGSGRMRLYRDARGVIQMDQLLLDSPALSVRIRPELGDRLDIAFLGGHWENTWVGGDTGQAQYRLFSPTNLTLLGFSDTDQDEDDRLKHYFSIGAGGGAEAISRIVGPFGVQFRGAGEALAMNRREKDAPNDVRYETRLEAEAGASLLFSTQAWSLLAFGEHVSQWDPRDADGASGIDRQSMSWGVKLQARFYPADARELSDPLGALPAL